MAEAATAFASEVLALDPVAGEQSDNIPVEDDVAEETGFDCSKVRLCK